MVETAATGLQFTNPSFEEWRDALAAILISIVQHRSARERTRRAGEGQSNRLVFRTMLTVIPTREHDAVLKLAQDPIEGSLTLAIKFIGQGLFQLGGTARMQKALESVARNHPELGDKMFRIGDSAWDNLGTDADMWHA